MRGLRTTIALSVLALVAVAACVLYAMGMIPYCVEIIHTGSMEPTIPSGNAVIVRKGTYRVGDAITFTVNGATVTHRLIKVDRDGAITTKGDANRSEDSSQASVGDIVGGVQWNVPHLGWVLIYLSQPAGALSIILCFLLLWQVNGFASALLYQPKHVMHE